MTQTPAHRRTESAWGDARLWLVLAVIVMAILLRPAMAAIGPLLDLIQASIPLSNAAASLLTALPMAMIGVGALLGPKLRNRVSEFWGIALGAVLITALTALRGVWWSPSGLIVSAVVIGAGIAMVQVLMPSFVKRHFEDQSPRVMGLYSTGIMGGAAAGAATAAPLAERFGWQGGIAIWWTFGVATLLLWSVANARRNAVLTRQSPAPAAKTPARPAALEASTTPAAPQAAKPRRRFAFARGLVGAGEANARARAQRRALASTLRGWELLVFFGLCTGAFTLILAWLPPYYTAQGLSLQNAGFLLGVYTLAEVGVGLLISAFIDRFPDRRGPLLLALSLVVVGLVLLIAVPMWQPAVISSILGVGTGALFALSLILMMDHARDPEHAGVLADFVQGGGYLIAAATPLAAGLLRDAFADLRGAWGLMLLGTLLLIVMATRFSPKSYAQLRVEP